MFATVGTPQDLIEAVLGEDGLATGGSVPAILVDCSTISADVSMQIREQLAACGTELLAAPVMGNPKVASVGQLTLAVSGPPSASRPPGHTWTCSRRRYICRRRELARTVKLCHNLFLGVVSQSLAEVTILAQKSGVSRAAFLTCLNKSVMGSQFTRYKSPAFVNLDFHPTFTATLLRKDFDLGLAAAREHEVPMPVASLVHQIGQALIGQRLRRAGFCGPCRTGSARGGPGAGE